MGGKGRNAEQSLLVGGGLWRGHRRGAWCHKGLAGSIWDSKLLSWQWGKTLMPYKHMYVHGISILFKDLEKQNEVCDHLKQMDKN